MKRVRSWLPAMGIFALALGIRVLYNVTVAHDYHPLHDSLFYQMIGFHLIQTHCFCLQDTYQTVDRAPLWPIIIGGLSLIFGPNDFFARLFLSCIGSGTCVLLYLFARDLFNRSIGLLAGIIACIYPLLYIYDGWLYTESLFTFLLFAVCYAVYRLQRRLTDSHGQRRLWVGIGLLLGLLSLTRPNGIIVIVLALAWALLQVKLKRLEWAKTARGALLMVGLACVLIAPWTVRNYLVSGAFVPVATGDGTVLLGAYNDESLHTLDSRGTWINPLKSVPRVSRQFPLYTCDAVCEVRRENTFKVAVVHWIQSHLSDMPYLLGLHFLNLWRPDAHEADLPTDRFADQPAAKFVQAMMQTFPIPVFILAALGCLVTFFSRRHELLFIYMMILLTIGEALFYYGVPRFRAPIEPMLLLLAAGAIWWLTQEEKGTLRWWWRQRRGVTAEKFQGEEQKEAEDEHAAGTTTL